MTQALEMGIVSDVPNQPKPNSRTHTFRCSDELWAASRAAADQLGTSVPVEIQKSLRNLVKRAEKRATQNDGTDHSA